MDYAIRIAQTANQALKNNPLLNTGELSLKPLLASSAQQMAADWSRDGIPEIVVLRAITEVCSRFKPTPENPRIGSFRYFDAAVRKAFLKSQQRSKMDALFADLK